MFQADWHRGKLERAKARPLRLEVLEERALLTLQGNALFPADNPWNEKITNAPVAANSAALVASIGATAGLHPDFGTVFDGALIGIPYNVVSGTQPKVTVVIDAYADESDLVPVPIPAGAVIEGDPLPSSQNTGDRHLLVYDQDHNIVYELFNTHRPTEEPDNKWHADSEAVWDMSKDSFRPAGFTSADAAGLPILPGLVRPDEVLDQGVINHALRFTVPRSDDAYVFPASHEAGVNNSAYPRMGERFRLKQSFDISSYPAADRVILQALKDYGMIVADNGSGWFLSGAPSSRWNDDDLHLLTRVLGSNFEAVNLSPIVSGIDQSSGPIGGGTSVTIHGQDFSGAAGQLQVFFGTTPAASVSILSDTTLVATSPAHAMGRIDVTVQTPYGTSAPSTSDQFTFSSAGVVTGRRVFYYNSSRYDTTGDPQTPLPFSDDNAIASDKVALRPGQSATFANYTSYTQGINGIMVDLQGAGTHTSITLANILNDFTFKVGNNASPGTWANAPSPIAVTVRTNVNSARNGAGTVSGSDRVELIWLNGAIQQEWLEVIVKATVDTGLAANDVFFFGSEIANTSAFNTTAVARTGTPDISGVQSHGANVSANIPITNIYDFDRDGRVDTGDISAIQTHGTNATTGLMLISPGANGPFAPDAMPAVLGDAGVASALAIRSPSPNPGPPASATWPVDRPGNDDVNHGPIASYFEWLAHETPVKSEETFLASNLLADELDSNDEWRDAL
jgi:hypothetical protein